MIIRKIWIGNKWKNHETSSRKKTLTCLYRLLYENWQIGNVPFSYNIKSVFFNSIQKCEKSHFILERMSAKAHTYTQFAKMKVGLLNTDQNQNNSNNIDIQIVIYYIKKTNNNKINYSNVVCRLSIWKQVIFYSKY